MNQPKYLLCDPDLMPEDKINTLTKVLESTWFANVSGC